MIDLIHIRHIPIRKLIYEQKNYWQRVYEETEGDSRAGGIEGRKDTFDI